jgi:CheY-like chemotaxis protein
MSMAKRILVVDDKPEILELVALLLEENGYEVLTASSGKEGLINCVLLKPDAVILDVMMPNMDGSEVFVKLRDDPETSNIPVIFLTAAVRPAEVPKSHKIGGHYFLAKPVKNEDLLEILKRIFSEPSA